MKCMAYFVFLALFSAKLHSSMPDSSFIQTPDGVKIRLVVAGQGRPLILVPGWTMTSEIFEGQIAEFSKSMQVVSMDPRGQGQSSRPARGYDSRHRAADIQAVIEGLQLKGAVLLGWSLGAVDVVSFLQRHGSSRLSGVVLVDNSVDKHYSSGQTGAMLLQKLNSLPYADVIGDFIPSIFSKPQPEARMTELKALSMLTPLDAAKESLSRASTGKGLAAALQGTETPVLYVVGERFAEEGRKLKEAMAPRLSLEVFEHSGHAMFVDEPARFNATLAAFIAKLK